MTNPPELIVLGANSLCGPYLLQQISDNGMTATVISRRAMQGYDSFKKLRMDLNTAKDWRAPTGAIVLSLLPIWILARILPKLAGVGGLIAVSSTSRFSKSNSATDYERKVAARLAEGEEALQAWAADNRATWTILRPTLIYDGANDGNITRLARFMRRWHFLPVAHPAHGLRQPIHAADVAQAMLKAIDNPAAAGQAFNISGGEILTYIDMAARIFSALGQPPYFVKIPVPLLAKLFGFTARIGLLDESRFNASIFQRMNEDLVFETQTGLTALNYQPRDFQPRFDQLKKISQAPA